MAQKIYYFKLSEEHKLLYETHPWTGSNGALSVERKLLYEIDPS
jgi:hypothetical protein